MKMPKKIKKKVLAALRSGEYDQLEGALTDGKGSFCCLGVMQHVLSDGKVECYGRSGDYCKMPSLKWYQKHGIEIGTLYSGVDDPHQDRLVEMNDSMGWRGGKQYHKYSFAKIADWIEKNIKTTD